MIDVVLPVLDEAAALPGVLASLPDGYRPIVVDNGSSDGSAGLARALGSLVVEEPVHGFGAACAAGLAAAEAEIVCFMDCDGSLDGADLPRVATGVASGEQDLVLGRRRPASGSWPLHAAIANRVLAAGVRHRTGLPLRDLGPMRAMRRTALVDLGMTDRRFGWPLEMVLRAAHGGWRVLEVDVPYRPRIGRSKVTGTVRGTMRAVLDMERVGPRPAVTTIATIAVLAKAPVPGRVKTRLCPPCSPDQASALARAALEDTLEASRSVPGTRTVLVLDGDPTEWVGRGIVVVPQRGHGLDERLAAAFADLGGPTVLVGMDTPQITSRHLTAAVAQLLDPGVGAVLGPATDGGYWLVGLPGPDDQAFLGVPMSTATTGASQLARLRGQGRQVVLAPVLQDVDRWDDAVAVAAEAPTSHFGRAVAAMAPAAPAHAGRP